jgi:type I restriction enzyme M protein
LGCRASQSPRAHPRGREAVSGELIGVAREALEHDGEPFEEKMKRLTSTLGEQFQESAKLEKAIATNLKGLGFKIC